MLPRPTASDVTFVMYNTTTADNLKFFTWDIELSATANAISLPANYSHGRIWFTVYDNNR